LRAKTTQGDKEFEIEKQRILYILMLMENGTIFEYAYKTII